MRKSATQDTSRQKRDNDRRWKSERVAKEKLSFKDGKGKERRKALEEAQNG